MTFYIPADFRGDEIVMRRADRQSDALIPYGGVLRGIRSYLSNKAGTYLTLGVLGAAALGEAACSGAKDPCEIISPTAATPAQCPQPTPTPTPTPSPTPTPGITYQVTGMGRSVFDGSMIPTYRARFSLADRDVDAVNGRYNTDTRAGSQTAIFDGSGLMFPRQISADVNGNTNIDFDGIPSGSGFDVENFKTMGMGINAPYPFGGSPINPGYSIRVRPGVQSHVYVVKDSRISKNYYDAFTDSMLFCTDADSGISFVDAVPSPIPEGATIVNFEGDRFITGISRDGFYIKYSVVRAPVDPTAYASVLVHAICHERRHGRGLDHSNDPRSYMRATALDPSVTITQNDIQTLLLKYKRDAGYELNGIDGGSTATAFPMPSMGVKKSTGFLDSLLSAFSQKQTAKEELRTFCEMPPKN